MKSTRFWFLTMASSADWLSFLSKSNGVNFNPQITVVNADDTIVVREMNLDGTFYDVPPTNNSFSDGSIDIMGGEEASFIDAQQDDSYFQDSGR